MPGPSIVVVTDLDGTLLDHRTYRFDAARPAIERLRDADVPLVLCTSKTRAEVEPIREMLDNRHPFIVENGGAVYIPTAYFPFAVPRGELRDGAIVIPIGDSHASIIDALVRASRESRVRVRAFAGMTDAEVAEATGLTLEDARRARQREFDEPFEILDAARAPSLLASIERTGKQWTRGGRFYHITGPNDKAVAVQCLAGLYRRLRRDVRIAGLGDAPNDLAFLLEVDPAIVMDSPHANDLLRLLPHARRSSQPGPAGWNEAVLQLLAEVEADR
jgi:mannosyl-3-phosphoglycerate phosphatase